MSSSALPPDIIRTSTHSVHCIYIPPTIGLKGMDILRSKSIKVHPEADDRIEAFYIGCYHRALEPGEQLANLRYLNIPVVRPSHPPRATFSFAANRALLGLDAWELSETQINASLANWEHTVQKKLDGIEWVRTMMRWTELIAPSNERHNRMIDCLQKVDTQGTIVQLLCGAHPPDHTDAPSWGNAVFHALESKNQFALAVFWYYGASLDTAWTCKATCCISLDPSAWSVHKKFYSPLHHAIQQNDMAAFKQLLKFGASHSSRWAHQSPLLLAVELDQCEMVELLLFFNADPVDAYSAVSMLPFPNAPVLASPLGLMYYMDYSNPNLSRSIRCLLKYVRGSRDKGKADRERAKVYGPKSQSPFSRLKDTAKGKPSQQTRRS